MKRVLAAAALGAAVLGAAAPVAATPGGYCDGKVDVMCREYGCQDDLPCWIEYCGVWYGGRCLS